MSELINVLVGIVTLILGVPIGNFLAKVTKDEFKQGQKWFKILVIAALIGAVASLISGNDVLLFTFLFIAIVTSRSLRANKAKKKK